MSEPIKIAKKPLIFYGWIIVFISLITLTISHASRYSFSVFYVAILNEFGWSRADTALAYSINLVVYALLSPVSGSLIDRFGPRTVFPIGAVISGVSLLGLSQINNLWQLYLFSGLLAVGIVLLGFVAHSCLLPRWFSLKLGTALGIAVVGIALGNVAPLPIQQIIDNIGWRGAYIVLAIISVSVIVPVTALFQRRSAPDIGLPLDGIAKPEINQDASLKKPDQKSLADLRIVDKEWAATDWTLGRALKTNKFWFLSGQMFLTGIAVNIIAVHMVALLVDAGYSRVIAAAAFALLGGLGSVSALGGYISDRIGRELTFTLGSIGLCVATFALILIKDPSTPWMLYFAATLFGVSQGINRPITMVNQADIFQGKHIGVIMGTTNLSFGMGGALGPWLAGYIFDTTGSYTPSLTVTILAFMGSLAFIWAAAPRKVRVVGGKVRQQAYS